MPAFALVRRGIYVDSVSLLQLTAQLRALEGVRDAAAVMATDLNRDVLHVAGLLVDDALAAGANDLVLAVSAEDHKRAQAALMEAEALLTRRRTSEGSPERSAPRSLLSARRADPEAQLALVSVPGPYAAAEARQALAAGLNVFLFSDNVALEDEVELKLRARERGLLVMGPDCGTAIIAGVGLGFANVVRRGSIGVVGASGTGIQEVTSLVHQAGQGLSHAIGTGSRDLHASVRGITTLQALALLANDDATETIVLVSKAGDATVGAQVLEALAATGKRAIAYLQGAKLEPPEGVTLAGSLEQAAHLATGTPAAGAEAQPLARRGEVRGLFCGGTLKEEAARVLGESVEHQLIDFGDDEYTRGRAHPMIDPTLRNQAILDAGRAPGVGALLLDFVLGLGAHPDPVGAAIEPIREVVNGGVPVFAHVLGTDMDPQGLSRQEDMLRQAGVHVYASNYQAALASCA